MVGGGGEGEGCGIVDLLILKVQSNLLVWSPLLRDHLS